MKIELRKLSLKDGKDIFDMIREIGPGENGFGNNDYNMEWKDFTKYCLRDIFRWQISCFGVMYIFF